MHKVNHYIPTDLEWAAQGMPCEPHILNRMCEQIFKHGVITDVTRHAWCWHHADGTKGVRGSSSQALTVQCEHIPNITYVVHLTGFRVTEIIETIITEAGA